MKKKTTTAEGEPEGLPEVTKHHWSVCSKGERPIGDGKHSGDRGAKTGEKRASMRKLGKTKH